MPRYIRYTLLLIAALCMWLGIAAYQTAGRLSELTNVGENSTLYASLDRTKTARQKQPPKNPVGPFLLPFHAFGDEPMSYLQALALQSQATELRERLSYMVFAKERLETQSTLMNVLQKQINRAPYNGAYWRDLVFVYHDLDVSDGEYQATFSAAKNLSRWNVESRAILLNRCVAEYQKLHRISSGLCAEIFTHLPMPDDVRRLSKLAGVEYSTLLQFLRQLGLQVTGDPE